MFPCLYCVTSFGIGSLRPRASARYQTSQQCGQKKVLSRNRNGFYCANSARTHTHNSGLPNLWSRMWVSVSETVTTPFEPSTDKHTSSTKIHTILRRARGSTVFRFRVTNLKLISSHRLASPRAAAGCGQGQKGSHPLHPPICTDRRSQARWCPTP